MRAKLFELGITKPFFGGGLIILRVAISSLFLKFVIIFKGVCQKNDIVLTSRKQPYFWCLSLLRPCLSIVDMWLSWLFSTKFRGYCEIIIVTALHQCIYSVAIPVPLIP